MRFLKHKTLTARHGSVERRLYTGKGDTAMFETTEPFQSFLNDIALLGVHSCEAGGLEYGLIKARSNERWWLVPTTPIATSVSGLAMFQPTSRTARLGKACLTAAMRTGLTGAWARDRIRLSGLPEIAGTFGVHAMACAYFTGTAGPHRKTAIQFMDKTGGILGYAKLSRLPRIRRHIRNEIEMLASVASLGLETIDVPSVLAIREDGDLSLLVTDSMKAAGHEAPLELGTSHLSFFEELNRKTGTIGAGGVLDELAQDLDLLRGSVGAAWIARIERCLHQLHPVQGTIPVCFAHGDFTPWNTFVQSGRLYVFDWEYAHPGYPVGFDYVHFRLSITPLGQQPELAKPLATELAFRFFNGDQRVGRRALLLAVLLHAVFYLHRLVEADMSTWDWPDASSRAAMIDHLLEPSGELK